MLTLSSLDILSELDSPASEALSKMRAPGSLGSVKSTVIVRGSLAIEVLPAESITVYVIT